MGEATFYLKAKFKSEREAELAVKVAKPVLDDLAAFHEDWQTIRYHNNIPVNERHELLLKKHPLVAKFVELPEPEPEPEDDDDVNMNYLAGKCEMHGYYEIYSDGEWVRLSCECWHLATWDNIEKFFAEIGAVEVGWISDEHIDPFDAILTKAADRAGSVDEFLAKVGKGLLVSLL